MDKLLNKRGVTLVETLFSAGILASVLVGVITVSVQTVDTSRRINSEYAATSIARSRIETAKAYIETNGFATLTSSSFGETNTQTDVDGVPDENGDYMRTTAVTTNYNSNARLTKISVDVKYKFRGKLSSHSINMTTVLASV